MGERRFRRGDRVTIIPPKAELPTRRPYKHNWEKVSQYLEQEGIVVDYSLDVGLVDDQYRVYFSNSDRHVWVFDRYLEKA